MPGQDRSLAESELRKQHYCRGNEATRKEQLYRRCDVKGYETGESWVVVDFNRRGTVVQVRRLERFANHAEAVKRWNVLFEVRESELGEPAKEARTKLAELGDPPEGAVSWYVWYSPKRKHLIGLYLVKPSDPNDPQIVELVRRVP